eukprot:COSAG03_NODE_27617_length_252_cov_0.673203_1_plen_33_part_10
MASPVPVRVVVDFSNTQRYALNFDSLKKSPPRG